MHFENKKNEFFSTRGGPNQLVGRFHVPATKEPKKGRDSVRRKQTHDKKMLGIPLFRSGQVQPPISGGLGIRGRWKYDNRMGKYNAKNH